MTSDFCLLYDLSLNFLITFFDIKNLIFFGKDVKFIEYHSLLNKKGAYICFRISRLLSGTYFTDKDLSVINGHMTEAIRMAKLAQNNKQVLPLIDNMCHVYLVKNIFILAQL